MKYRYPLLLLAVGLLLVLAGGFFKTRHWPGADGVVLTGLALQGGAFLTFLYQIFASPK